MIINSKYSNNWLYIYLQIGLLFLFANVRSQAVGFNDFLRAEGIEDANLMDNYDTQYINLLNDLKTEIGDIKSIRKQHEIIFEYLRKNFLKKYSYIPFLTFIFDINHYNYLTASILYTLITEYLGHTYQLYMTETHVFLQVLDSENEEIYIDLSKLDSGFDSKDDEKAILQIMFFNKLVTQEEINNTQPDVLVKNYFESATKISLDELLPLYYTQIALSHYSSNRYSDAYKNMESAMRLNPDLARVKNNYISIWTTYRNRLFQDKEYNTLDSLLISSASLVRINDDFAFIYTEFLKTYVTVLINESISPSKILVVLSEISPYIAQGDLDELKKKLYIQRTEELLAEQKYETAYYLIKDTYLSFPEVTDIQGLFLTTCQNFMGVLVNAGRYKIATAHLDTLLLIKPDDILIKQLYSNVLLAEMSLNQTRYLNNPVAAEALLVVANVMDTSNVSIKQSLVHLYHSRAMQFTRENNLESARIEIEKGLLIDPNNAELLEDLRLLNEQLSQ